MIKQLAHVCIHTTDLEATERFYVGILGLERKFSFTKNGSLHGFYIHLGADTFIEVFRGERSEEGSIKHLAIEVDDIDEMIRTLRENGCKATDKKVGADGSWQCWTEDPNGVRIEFHHYTENSRQRIGGTCEANW